MVESHWGRSGKVYRRSWGRAFGDFLRHRLLHSSFLIFAAFCGMDWIIEDQWGDLFLNIVLYMGFESWRTWRRPREGAGNNEN